MNSPEKNSPKKPSNLVVRILSALVLIPLALGLTWLGGWGFQLLLCIAVLIMYFEFKNMVLSDLSKVTNKVRVSKILWLLFGAIYVSIPVLAIAYIRTTPLPPCAPFLDMSAPCDNSVKYPTPFPLFWLFAVVWSTDIGAYLAGRTIGGPKLAPAISPKKTWAGLFGGMLAAALVGDFILRWTEFWYVLAILPLQPWIMGAVFAVISQAGDLFESWVKRRYGVKDSGRLIPGHGGLLDRVDGLMFAAPVFAALLYKVFGL